MHGDVPLDRGGHPGEDREAGREAVTDLKRRGRQGRGFEVERLGDPDVEDGVERVAGAPDVGHGAGEADLVPPVLPERVGEVVGEGGELVDASGVAATVVEEDAPAGGCLTGAGLLNRVRAERFAATAGSDDGDGEAATRQVEEDRGFLGEEAVAEADEGQERFEAVSDEFAAAEVAWGDHEAPARRRDAVGKSDALGVRSSDRAPLALAGGYRSAA